MRRLVLAALIVAGGGAVGMKLNAGDVTPKGDSTASQVETRSEPLDSVPDLGLGQQQTAGSLQDALVGLGDLPGYQVSGYDPAPTAGKLCPFVTAMTYTATERVSAGFQEPLSGRMAAQTITNYEPGVASAMLEAIVQGSEDCQQFSDSMGAWTVSVKQAQNAVSVTLDAVDQGISIDVQYTQIGNRVITSMTAGWDGHRSDLVAAMSVKAAARLA